MEQITSPVKAIRAYCLECVGHQKNEVKNCTITACPLFPFRFGRNPFHGRSRENLHTEGNEEEKSDL